MNEQRHLNCHSNDFLPSFLSLSFLLFHYKFNIWIHPACSITTKYLYIYINTSWLNILTSWHTFHCSGWMEICGPFQTTTKSTTFLMSIIQSNRKSIRKFIFLYIFFIKFVAFCVFFMLGMIYSGETKENKVSNMWLWFKAHTHTMLGNKFITATEICVERCQFNTCSPNTHKHTHTHHRFE